MHYLIDGHNLIAHMDDIDLSDPDDEAQLIMRLRQWVAAGRKRRLTVYFDAGLPGGRSPHFSGGPVEVIFASSGQEADDLLRHRIRRVHNPPEYTLVSSDRAVQAAAAKRKMPLLDSGAFAAALALEAQQRSQPAAEPEADELALSAEEVAEWLEMFGGEPETPTRKRRPRRKRPKTSPEPPEKKTPKPDPARPADELKESGAKLSQAEVAQWLELFGDEPDQETVRKVRREIKQRREEKRRRRGPARRADELKESGARLSRDEVEEWLDIFEEEDEE